MQAATQPATRDPRPTIISLIVGLPVVALLLRFAMRALGVRPDVPFPNLIYSTTNPIVEPFYSFFPNNPRFDTNAFEPASLLAAAALFLLIVLLYLLAFVLLNVLRNHHT